MTVDFEVFENVRQLRRVGLRPPEQLANRIIRAGDAAIQPLLELATSEEAFNEGSPANYGPLHALRLLGELDSLAIIEPLLDSYPMDLGGEEGDPADIWDTELPQILGKFGEAAIEPLWAYVDNSEHAPINHSAAYVALAYVTAVAPQARDAIIAGLRERIAAGDKTEASYALLALANIGAPELYSEVMAQYRAGHFDTEIIPASAARQLLLSKKNTRLACATHPLWERYDQHGPFDPATRR
jgi:hypothetical protein